MGRYFGCEPAQLLERDYFRWSVNVAAYETAAKAEADAAKKNAPSLPNRGRRF